jgi:ribosomal protein L37E
MSRVQTCERCGYRAYESEGIVSRRTAEFVTDDGTILSRDWTLCRGCTDRFLCTETPRCPFCLEVVMRDESPRECPHRSRVDA